MIKMSPWVLLAISVVGFVASNIILFLYNNQESHIKEAQIAIKIWSWMLIAMAGWLFWYSVYCLVVL